MTDDTTKKVLDFISKPENREITNAITMRVLLKKEIEEKQAELAKYEKIIADHKMKNDVITLTPAYRADIDRHINQYIRKTDAAQGKRPVDLKQIREQFGLSERDTLAAMERLREIGQVYTMPLHHNEYYID